MEEQGRLGEAAPLYHVALSAQRRTLGEDHPTTLASLYNTAGLLRKQGRRAEALALSRQALAAFRRVLGEGHPSTQMALRQFKQLQ
jgi:hypothetical protein